MRSLTFHRTRGYYGVFRALKILVDDQPVAKIKQGQTITVDLPDQAQWIWGKMDWANTEALDLRQIGEAQMVVFQVCWSPLPWKNKTSGLSADLPFQVYVVDLP